METQEGQDILKLQFKTYSNKVKLKTSSPHFAKFS